MYFDLLDHQVNYTIQAFGANEIYSIFRMAQLYSFNFIQAQSAFPYEFCYQVFSGWDFAIRDKYAKTKHASIRTQLKVSPNYFKIVFEI